TWSPRRRTRRTAHRGIAAELVPWSAGRSSYVDLRDLDRAALCHGLLGGKPHQERLQPVDVPDRARLPFDCRVEERVHLIDKGLAVALEKEVQRLVRCHAGLV